MSTSWAETTRQVVARANDRCEYCRMHQSLQGATFHIEHVTPQSAGGSDAPDNLALACPGCNLGKSNRTIVTDPETETPVPLFNPWTQRWADHFAWAERRVVGRTPVGRATVAALNLNHPRRVRGQVIEKATVFRANSTSTAMFGFNTVIAADREYLPGPRL